MLLCCVKVSVTVWLEKEWRRTTLLQRFNSKKKTGCFLGANHFFLLFCPFLIVDFWGGAALPPQLFVYLLAFFLAPNPGDASTVIASIADPRGYFYSFLSLGLLSKLFEMIWRILAGFCSLCIVYAGLR